MNFSKQKNGYNTKEVDDLLFNQNKSYEEEIAKKNDEIAKLKIEISKLHSKGDSIALALTAAVDKAKEIEDSSKNIYKLKIEQMTILYTKWEALLNEMLKKYPEISAISNVKEDLLNLKNSIKNALKDDFNIDVLTGVPSTDPIRKLLTRLIGMKAQAEAREDQKIISDEQNKIQKVFIERKTKISASDKTELQKIEDKTNKIKPIASVNIAENDSYENPVDKFLNDDDVETSAFIESLTKKKITDSVFKPNDTGFDLNECVNPTEDLNEIMKSFDFLNEED